MALFPCTLGVVKLGGKEHDIHGADLGGIVGSLGRVYADIAERALHPQSVATDCFQVRAARDEGDVVPRCREPGAEIAADTATAHDRNFHAAVARMRITLATSRCPISCSRLKMDSG